jgi:hypothetical protein
MKINIIWNAHLNVLGATEVGLGWGTDDPKGGVGAYTAFIAVTLPQRAGTATVNSQKPNEKVVVNRDATLACGPNGIEANVTYRVSPNAGANGTQVGVNVATQAGQKNGATKGVLGTATGQVGQDITVKVHIPGTCA